MNNYWGISDTNGNFPKKIGIVIVIFGRFSVHFVRLHWILLLLELI